VSPPAVLWRIATDTPHYRSDDRSGKGAEMTGGRWNRMGTAMLYLSASRALACLETLVHFGVRTLPFNRYLIRVEVPARIWKDRVVFDPKAHVGWDAEPPGQVSLDWGTDWARSMASLLAEVPSVIVPEESNVLLNPLHPRMRDVRVEKVRRWTYDVRLRPLEHGPVEPY